jgi:hypothetical protein
MMLFPDLLRREGVGGAAVTDETILMILLIIINIRFQRPRILPTISTLPNLFEPRLG